MTLVSTYMSRMNEEEVDGLLDHQLHIWMLATLTKMLRWEQGKLVHEARERWDTIYIYSGKGSERDALLSKLFPNILVFSCCLEKAQSLVSSNTRSLFHFSRS